MATERNVLMITRHGIAVPLEGETKEDPSLTAESIRTMYRAAKGALSDFVRECGVTPDTTVIRHTPKRRTAYTALARAAGAYDVLPIPSSHAHLDALRHADLAGIEMEVDPRLDFAGLAMNEPAYFNVGDRAYITAWMKHPDATHYDGVLVDSFNKVVSTRGKPALVSLLYHLKHGKRLAIAGTHSGLAESVLAAAVNSGRDTPLAGVDAIGGPVGKEDFALLYLDRTPAGSQASLVRNGESYAVDLGTLMGAR